MPKKSKRQGADIVFDKDGKSLATQPNQLTDMYMVPTVYSERAQDELVFLLQPYYDAAKRKENRQKEGTQLMIPFNNEDAYLVTPETANKIQHEGDFIATIRFRDLPGITPRHYGELRQVLKGMVSRVGEVRTDDGVLTTNLLDIIEEYETHETINPKTGEKMTVKSNSLKRNEVKIRIRSEILRNNFFLTDAGYTQFYFPATRHTKTATANRMLKWLSKWRGIKKNQMVLTKTTADDGSEQKVGYITFRADYMEVRAVCGLFNSKDGKIVNGEEVDVLAASLAKKAGKSFDKCGKTEQRQYLEAARQRASEKYAYYSEFAKRYLAQAKKELDDLTVRGLADITFDYRAIFADGRAKGKVPLQVEFTLKVFDLGLELYENKELAAKEKQMREMMKERLALKAEQINAFIRRLQPGDHDHLLTKIRQLIDLNMANPRDDVQRWAVKSLNTFFEKELPELRGFAPAEEIKQDEEPTMEEWGD